MIHFISNIILNNKNREVRKQKQKKGSNFTIEPYHLQKWLDKIISTSGVCDRK